MVLPSGNGQPAADVIPSASIEASCELSRREHECLVTTLCASPAAAQTLP
jgi:hypothetical protein